MKERGMKIVFHEAFYVVYASDPAADRGRMESIMGVIEPSVEVVQAVAATADQIRAVHTDSHLKSVKGQGVYYAAALAAGGAIQAATIGLEEPCMGVIRPPGHHASADSAWGFCYFNNMAVALQFLKDQGKIKTAYVLDIDLHFGDGTANIFSEEEWVRVHNVEAGDRESYLHEVAGEMARCEADLIGISAGFDNHEEDWGSTLKTEDYTEIGALVRAAAQKQGGGCFALLEGGYNHDILGYNVMALIEGLSA
jgi:acetoin utilization deacetylase AcuC-like enzyme